MIDEEKVKRAKNIAAQKAFETYGNTLQSLLQEQGITDLAKALADTTHIHEAIMLGQGEVIVVRCQWDFTTHPAVVQRALASAKVEGTA